jgi:pimeloyl-ACP methyl ester carboxylesterase
VQASRIGLDFARLARAGPAGLWCGMCTGTTVQVDPGVLSSVPCLSVTRVPVATLTSAARALVRLPPRIFAPRRRDGARFRAMHTRTTSREVQHAGSPSVSLLAASPLRILLRALAGAGPKALLALCLLALACSGCGGESLKNVVQRDLPSRDGLTCRGYLGWNSPDVQHVFLWMNGTGVYSSAFTHPSAEAALHANPVAYLTFDKPGIRAPFEDPAELSVKDDELEQYTQGHMLECARQAMTWAQEQFGDAVQFHLRGHSEGTLIALFLYEKLLSEEPVLAARVSSLVLSGVGLEPFDALVERQLSEMPAEQANALRAAIQSCDWGVLRNQLATSCKYLEDAYARPSGRSVFESIALRSPSVSFFVFQGNNDVQTPARYVRELEAWNSQLGHLDMTFRYYEGAHVGAPPEIQREVSELLVRLTARTSAGTDVSAER